MTTNKATASGPPTVLEERFDVPPPSDGSRVRISEQQHLTRGQFNTLHNPVTRELTITSPSLVFNGSVRTLEALRTTRDVTRVTLIADEVRIEQPLVWKGAAVDIYARRLVFRRRGRIETTPESYAGAAFTERRSDGRPIGDDGSIRAADGRDGEPGGDIRLFVTEVDWGAEGTTRLITNGAAGQPGERGGTLPFVPRPNGPPTKDVKPVTRTDVRAIFADAGNSTAQLNDIKHWATAGGVGSDGVNTTWQKVTGDELVRGQLIEYSDHEVTDVRIGLGFMKVLALTWNEVRVPLRDGPSRRRTLHADRSVQLNAQQFREAWEQTTKIEDPWTPSNGEDAFPSGATGRGGAGGSLSVMDGVHVPAWAFSAAGGASERSPDVPGGAPGKPRRYLCVAFNAAQFAPDPLNPTKSIVRITEYLRTTRIVGETKPGRSAAGSAKGAGDDGAVVVQRDAHAWMEPRLLRIVADHARELYQAGHRERAWERLAPYWSANRAASAATHTADARSSLRAIENLVENYQQNLDVYGNPPGWVPRFSSSSYLQTYLADRKFSYRFVGVMEQATRLMDTLEHATSMLGGLAASTEEAIDRLRDELFGAFQRFDDAARSLDEATAALQRAQQRLDALENDATLRAVLEAKDRAVVKAVFDVSGAILKAVPAYQPALAGVGTVLESVGSVVVDNMGTGEPVNGWKALETISGSVATTLKENAGSFRSQLQDHLKEKYRDQLNPDEADLRTRVEQMRTQVATGQEEYDRAVLAAHGAVARDAELAELLSSDEDIASRLAEQAVQRDEVTRQLEELNSALRDVELPSSQSGFAAEAATRARQRLLIARAKVYTMLADAQEGMGALEREMASNEKRREELTAERDALAARRTALEEREAALKKLLPDLAKLDANTSIRKATKNFDKALDAAERLAKGATSVAGSIRAATTEPDAESDEVVALRTKILEGPLGEEYAAIQAEVDVATGTMNRALAELMSCSQRVLTLSADFTGALQSSIDIARNRLSFARGVDTGLRASLVAMQRQAQERMDYYLYLFRRAYMYEFCELPGAGVATLNTFIAHLDEWLNDSRAAMAEGAAASARNDALRGLGMLTTMNDRALAELGNDALRNTLSALAQQLLERRQGQGAPVGNKLVLSLEQPQLDELQERRTLALARALHLIPDANDRRDFFKRRPLLRITSVSLERGDVHIRADREPPPIEVLVEFGREMRLWDGKRYVLFRIASSEKPLSFGFTANRFERIGDGLWQCDFTADSRGDVDELFHTVSMEAMGKKISYTEINPSFLSSVRISIRMGADRIAAIPRFRLAVGWQSH